MSPDDPEPANSRAFEQPLRSAAPDAEEITAALERLPEGADRRQAALHLATPVHEVVGVGIWMSRGSVRYRRHRLPVPEGGEADEIAAITGQAAELARLGHADDDRYLDLSPDRDPVMWCKPVVSGAYRRLFGSQVLLDGPTVAAEPQVPPEVLFEALRRWLDDDSFRPPAVADLADGTWLLHGSSATLRLS